MSVPRSHSTVRQANPLNVPRPTLDVLGTPRIMYAAAPLVVPMTLQLSSLSLRAIVVLVVSRQKGITLVFKNDPLESVNVSSSFDGVESVAGFIQQEIEGQLREAFRSDLPSIIHRLSQKWLSGEVQSAAEDTKTLNSKGRVVKGFEKDAKIETRTAYDAGHREGQPGRRKSRGRHLTTKMGSTSISGDSESIDSEADTTFSSLNGSSVPSARRRSNGRKAAGHAPRSQTPMRDSALESVPESIEHYDPTYGLRPESFPQHAGFTKYQRLVRSNSSGRGLGDVLHNSSEDENSDFEGDRTGEGSFDFDIIGLRDLVEDAEHTAVPDWVGTPAVKRGHSHRATQSLDSLGRLPFGAGLETIPAVGGGTITRPRVLHTQSQMRSRTASSGSLSAHGSPSTSTTRVPGSSSSTIGDLLGSPPSFRQMIEDRQDFARNRPYAASGTSTPRFPFPKIDPVSPPMLAGSAPLLSRRGSTMSALARNRSPHRMHRSNLSFSSMASAGAETTAQRGSSMFPSAMASTYSSPPSSVPSPQQSSVPVAAEEPEEVYPPPRPDVIDLLSRSPSSVLENSFAEDLSITVSPTGNDSCAHLATLTHSNHTLSPFTRNHEHFAARSSPHVLNRLAGTAPLGTAHIGRSNSFMGSSAGIVSGTSAAAGNGPGTPSGDTVPIKANRKRLHRLGSANVAHQQQQQQQSQQEQHQQQSRPDFAQYDRSTGQRGSSLSYARSSSTPPGTASRSGSSSRIRVTGTSLGGGDIGPGWRSHSGPARAPSELSDYFPSSVPDALASFRRRMAGTSGGM